MDLRTMHSRVEDKYVCTTGEMTLIRARLSSLMPLDSHCADGGYCIRSLYFDDDGFSCAADVAAGTDDRTKYRLRIYNASKTQISLEIKEKLHGYTHKSSTKLDEELCRALMRGEPLRGPCADAVPNRLFLAQHTQRFLPKLIVEYRRLAFVSELGNVRITLDYSISHSGAVQRFLDTSLPLTPDLPMGMHVLEIKYDQFLPSYIAQALELGTLLKTPFSKYTTAVNYLRGGLL